MTCPIIFYYKFPRRLLPLSKFLWKLEYLCKFYGIKFVIQEESYTSKGKIINADVSGALNILRKSKVVDLKVLYHRGEVDTPVRIRIA